MSYDVHILKKALMFNAVEMLPTNDTQLEEEIVRLVKSAHDSGQAIRHYIGFEISGRIHIGTGMMAALKIKKLQEAGVVCSVFLADYHTWINEKLDGRLETIRRVRDEYFKPVFQECCRVVGCDVDAIEFVSAQDLYRSQRNNHAYLDFVLACGKELTLARVNKSITVTGKKEGDSVSFGLLCYPVMQVADAFFMNTHIVHAGIDQRKCHVLMREVATNISSDYAISLGSTQFKPLAIHHTLLLGLGINASQVQARMSADVGEELKMSKSKRDSAVWVDDTPEEIARKINKAYCPIIEHDDNSDIIASKIEFNPILQWCRVLLFPAGRSVIIRRPEKHGGDVIYETYDSLHDDFVSGRLHPLDLKQGVASCLSEWFTPIRQWTEQHPEGLDILTSLGKA